jgi:hypothetical protein
MTTLRPLGPRVTFTAFGQGVDAAFQLLAGLGVENEASLGRAYVHTSYDYRWMKWEKLLDDGQDVVFAHDQVLDAVEFDLGAGRTC